MPAGRDRGERWEDASARMKREKEALARQLRECERHNAFQGDPSRRIRSLLDRASGQLPEAAKLFLREVMAIVDAGAAPPDWRNMVETEYPQLVRLLDYVIRHDVDGKRRKPAPAGHNSALTEDGRKLVLDHLPLVRKLARDRATEITPAPGDTDFDEDLFAALERIGLQVLEAKTAQWDQARGVNFGAFVTKRVAGAMDNYLTRERPKTMRLPAGDEGEGMSAAGVRAKETWKLEAHGKPVKGSRTTTGGKKVKSYIETPNQGPSRLIPANPVVSGKVADVLAQLTDKERAVYEGRVLADPPLSLAVLATKLNVSRPRIVALEKNARRRLSELLRR